MKRKRPGFISLGAAALIAGCGGGVSSGVSTGRDVPPTNPNSGPMATASLKVQIPARGVAAARRRRQWISPSSVSLGVRVLASPMPNPTPTENVYTLPTPGAVPTSITVQVPAPVSDDTFVASVYDSNHNLLATGSSAPTVISLGGTPPPVSVTMLGVASGIQYTVAGSTPATWRVLENLGTAQTTTVEAQPVDADDNLIPGTLATPATLSATDGVSLSTTSITSATSLTATYPSNTGGSGIITSPLALNAGTSPLNAAVDGDYYVYVDNSDGTVYVIDGLTQKQAGSVLTGATGSQQIAALSGCASGAFAVSGNSAGAYSFFVPAPTTANPTPGPVVSPLPAGILSANPFSYGAAGDSHCDAFYNNINGSGDPVIELSGFDSTVTANASFASGYGWDYALKSIGGDLYSAATPGLDEIQALFVPESSGGAASMSAIYTAAVEPNQVYVAGSGSSVFLVGNACSGQPVLQSLSGGSLITLSQFAAIGGAAEATDNTVYLAGLSEASGNAPTLAYGSIGSIATAPTVALGAQPVDVAVTPDQQYVCVIESPSGTSGQIEFFRRLPSPSLVATVPLSSSSAPQSFSIGP